MRICYGFTFWISFIVCQKIKHLHMDGASEVRRVGFHIFNLSKVDYEIMSALPKAFKNKIQMIFP